MLVARSASQASKISYLLFFVFIALIVGSLLHQNLDPGLSRHSFRSVSMAGFYGVSRSSSVCRAGRTCTTRSSSVRRHRSATLPSRFSWPRNSGALWCTRPRSPSTSSFGAGAIPTTCSRPPSRGSAGRCATLVVSREPACPRPRAGCRQTSDRCPRLRDRQPPLGGEGPAARRSRRPSRRQPRRRHRRRRGRSARCGRLRGLRAGARYSGLDEVVRLCITDGRPFLGICVGLQLLFEGSEEDPDVPGLGVLAGTVRALRTTERLPQMQWNLVCQRAGASSRLLGDAASRLVLLRPLLRPGPRGRRRRERRGDL